MFWKTKAARRRREKREALDRYYEVYFEYLRALGNNTSDEEIIRLGRQLNEMSVTKVSY